MKKIFLILFIGMIASCSGNKTYQNTVSSDTIVTDSVDTVFVDTV